MILLYWAMPSQAQKNEDTSGEALFALLHTISWILIRMLHKKRLVVLMDVLILPLLIMLDLNVSGVMMDVLSRTYTTLRILSCPVQTFGLPQPMLPSKRLLPLVFSCRSGGDVSIVNCVLNHPAVCQPQAGVLKSSQLLLTGWVLHGLMLLPSWVPTLLAGEVYRIVVIRKYGWTLMRRAPFLISVFMRRFFADHGFLVKTLMPELIGHGEVPIEKLKV
mmetsp:Transcript_23531/g.34211  ORF Transcript_23531/g.34211 Transcript_23531/m.34211 type:complete len:219 (-) Transcript_23531:327-983(-)